MKSKLINYTDKGFKKLLLEEILRINPLLTLGEDITNVVATVRDGRNIDRFVEPTNTVKTIQFDRLPEGAVNREKIPPAQNIQCAPQVRINMRDLEERKLPAELNFDLAEPAYLHFYYLKVPHREWLEEYEVGDLVFMSVMDMDTFTPVPTPVTLTQEIVDEHSYVTLRFALST